MKPLRHLVALNASVIPDLTRPSQPKALLRRRRRGNDRIEACNRLTPITEGLQENASRHGYTTLTGTNFSSQRVSLNLLLIADRESGFVHPRQSWTIPAFSWSYNLVLPGLAWDFVLSAILGDILPLRPGRHPALPPPSSQAPTSVIPSLSRDLSPLPQAEMSRLRST